MASELVRGAIDELTVGHIGPALVGGHREVAAAVHEGRDQHLTTGVHQQAGELLVLRQPRFEASELFGRVVAVGQGEHPR